MMLKSHFASFAAWLCGRAFSIFVFQEVSESRSAVVFLLGLKRCLIFGLEVMRETLLKTVLKMGPESGPSLSSIVQPFRVFRTVVRMIEEGQSQAFSQVGPCVLTGGISGGLKK